MRGNDIYTDSEGIEKNREIEIYNIFSTVTDNATSILRQFPGTKFNKDSVVGAVGFSQDDGFGYIFKDWSTVAEDPDNYVNQFYAPTYVHSHLKVLRFEDDLVVRDQFSVEFKFDKTTYAGIATQNIILVKRSLKRY